MKKAIDCRKRPCRICKRWFTPHPRLKDRQMTCGEESCKREWHRRKCAQWNKENSEVIKKERLAHRLKAAACASGKSTEESPSSPTSIPLQAEQLLPWIQEVIMNQLIVMLDPLARHCLRRAQEVIGKQVSVNTG